MYEGPDLSRVTLLSGGVGGARAARGFAGVVPAGELTVVVNIGDDDRIHGVHVSADADTVLYTLAHREGPEGWGLRDDTFTAMEALAASGEDTTFRLGDRDLALCLIRTQRLDAGEPLSAITADLANALGVGTRVIPASDDPVRTRIRRSSGEWMAFQEYFVMRGHRDEVAEVEYAGAEAAAPAPGVLAAIEASEIVVIAPSNPPLSVWPILAVPGIRDAIAAKDRVVAISPLFGGKALKGPADRVMASLGLAPGNAGVAAAYDGLITELVVDDGDSNDEIPGLEVRATDTRIQRASEGARLARFILE